MKHSNNSGYVALILVLTISAVVLATASTVALLAIGEAQSSFALFNGENTLQFVEGCMEDALLSVQASASYSGGTLTRPEGTCNITTTKSGNNWTVTATTTATTYVRTVQTQFTRAGNITLTSWKEL